MRFCTHRQKAPSLVRTTVVGNYPRVGDTFEEQSLRRAIARFDKGEISAAELGDAEREVVKGVLREQNEGGIDLVTDGQISWYYSQRHIARRLASGEINGIPRTSRSPSKGSSAFAPAKGPRP